MVPASDVDVLSVFFGLIAFAFACSIVMTLLVILALWLHDLSQLIISLGNESSVPKKALQTTNKESKMPKTEPTSCPECGADFCHVHQQEQAAGQADQEN